MQRSKAELAERARAHKDRAAELTSKGRSEDAVTEYLAALNLVPGDVFARQRAAELLARLGHGARAIEHYRVLTGKFAAEGRLMKAIATCNLILRLDPSHAETLITLSALYAERDSPTSPVRMPAAMSAAITASPSEPPPAIRPETLARIPLFSDLARAPFESILRELECISVPAGETVIEEGQAGDAMFAIASGTVHVERRSGDGHSRVVAEMTEGEFFGEMSLLSRCPRLASVVAATDCEVLKIHRAALEQIARAHPRLGDVLRKFHKERLIANVSRASALFGQLPAENQRALADLFRLEAHPAGVTLLEEGQPGGAGLFFLLRGRCDVFHRREDGAEEAYPSLVEGDVFGEVSLLQGGPLTASVRTTSTSVVLGIQREWVDVLMLQQPNAREVLYDLASERLGRTQRLLSSEKVGDSLI